MAAAKQLVCSICKRVLTNENRWVTLDGGETWCVACWQRHFQPEDGKDEHAFFQGEDSEVADTESESFAPADSRDATFAETAGANANANPKEETGNFNLGPEVAKPTIPLQSSEARFSAPSTKTSGLAIASLVVALVGIVPFCGGGLLGPVAIVLGYLALRAMAKDPGLRGRQMAVAGVLTGVAVLFGWTVIVVVLILRYG